MAEILGVGALVDTADLWKLLARLGINLAFAVAVIHWAYLKTQGNREYVFTFYLLNLITFSLCFLLRKVPAELGFALAIFAVFGVLRYRTEQIRIRELTYLFVVIGIAVVNAVANKKVSALELLAVNVAITGMTLWLERGPYGARESWIPFSYDKLELLKPGRHEELLKDIRDRTGLRADRVEVEGIDLLRDAAELRVYHRKGDEA